MTEGKYFCYNNNIYQTGTPVFTPDNRSFRYGDGCFETMKMVNDDIALSHYHFERLFSSIYLLKFKPEDFFTHNFLSEQIKKLTQKNNHQRLARIRLTIFRGDGSLQDANTDSLNYVIQSWQLDEKILKFNKNGLTTGLFKDAKKANDAFSHIKSNNYLPYLMAGIYAKENRLDDAFVLNSFNRIADATIANIFIAKDGKIKTPALGEGCVAGVMRRHLLKCIREENIPVAETQLEIDDLINANEIFLTNAIRRIQWVKQFEKNTYSNELAKYLHEKFA
jgi:branched-chain amino acid aminotransferase